MHRKHGLTLRMLLVALTLLIVACSGPTSNMPNTFSFTPVNEAEPGELVRSNEVEISGLTDPVPGTVSTGGTLIVDGSAVGNSAEIHNGARLAVELTASTERGESESVTVTVGGFEAVFTVTTRAGPAVTFASAPTEAAPGATVELNWTADAILDTLELTSSTGLDLDVSGLTSAEVTLPTNVASVVFTLTGSNSADPSVTSTDTAEVVVPLWVCENPADVITFESDELQGYLRVLLGIPTDGDITCAHAQGVVDWETPTWQDEPGTVESIVGIQHLTNLERFWAEFNDIADLTPLANLTSLRELLLDGNRVLDLSPIANLTNLTLVGFWDNGPVRIDYDDPDLGPDEYCRDGITDISPLANLVNVETLYLSCNNITDISAVAGMESLELAFLIQNRINDISPLSGLTNLQALRFSENRVASDNGVLATLTGLRWLEMAYNRLEDDSLAALETLPNLFAIDLEGNFLTDLSPILDNAALPAAEGVEDQDQQPIVATVSLGYNCLPDPAAVQTDLIAQGFAVIGVDEEGAMQRPEEDCLAGPAGMTTDPGFQERLQLFRERTGMR